MRRRILFSALILSLLIGFDGFSQTQRRPTSSRTSSERVTQSRNLRRGNAQNIQKKKESATSVIADTRNNKNNNGGNNGYRPGNNNNNRPTGNNNNGYRPGNNNNNRPTGNNNNGYRPGGNRPPVHSGYRPSRPGYRPYLYGRFNPPPARPYRPAFRVYSAPTIPVGYVPLTGSPIIDSILGLTFGIAYNASLDYLYDNGYSVDGYDDGNIYLRDVRDMGYNWEDAILNYDSGHLCSAQFINSTSYNNGSRYAQLYNSLCSQYGTPISINGGNGVTWFSGNGKAYITLQYGLDTVNSYPRYYTTLTYTYPR